MSPDTFKILASLPWTIQLVLASGFCAYRISYFGLRSNHKAIDEIFISASFGLVAVLILQMKSPYALAIWTTHITVPITVYAFLGTMLTGILWRTIGRHGLVHIFRITGYSWTDETVSAWEHLQESKCKPSQLTVETDDGWTLFCTNTAPLDKLPHGPYVLGTTGDILMYVDQSLPPPSSAGEDAEIREVQGVFDKEWGSMITYLPKERIRSVKIRYEPVTSRAEEEGWRKVVGLKVAAAKRRLLGSDQAPE